MTISLKEAFSEKDYSLIDTYRAFYSSSASCDFISSKDWLEPYFSAKQNLFHLLNDSLVYTFKTTTSDKKDALAIAKDLYKKLPKDKREAIEEFCTNLKDAIRQNCYWYERQSVENIFREYPFYENHIHYSSKTFSIPKGIKPIKAVSLLAKTFNVPLGQGFEEYRILASRVIQTLSQKTLNVNISIHPLDYMTMSDNSNNWSSCMSWSDDGCYKAGTVEMLNSPLVLVAYASSSSPYTPFNNFSWNNKIWRQLFIFDPSTGIFSIKAYPNENAALTKEILSQLAVLAKKNFSLEPSPIEEYDPDEANPHAIYFRTNRMYNDFGATTHFASYFPNVQDHKEITYSGLAECISCGEIDFPFNDSEELFCYNVPCWVCANCGKEFTEDEEAYYGPNGEGPYDEECYNDLFFYDELAQEDLPREDYELHEEPLVLYKDERHYAILYTFAEASLRARTEPRALVQDNKGKIFEALLVNKDSNSHFLFYHSPMEIVEILDENETF